MIAQRDPHGLTRWFYHTRSARHAPTLRALFADDGVPCQLDMDGVKAHLGMTPLDAEMTCFAEVKLVRPGSRLTRNGERWVQEAIAFPEAKGTLIDFLASRLAETLRKDTALALGGGLDAALLLGIIRRVLGQRVQVVALVPDIAGYSERETIVRNARSLDMEPLLLSATERDFVAALSDTVGSAEVPLYNMHPVSKLLMARRLKERGITRIITGDGADQVFAGVPGWDYLPIVGALFAAAEVELICPYLHPWVIAWAIGWQDPSKSVLRMEAQRLLPPSIVDAPKVGQLAPPMDLSGVVSAREIENASKIVPLPTLDVRLVTLALLHHHFPRLRE